MKEKKIVKTMDVLWLVFLILAIVSVPIKAPFGWWMWGIGCLLAFGAVVVKIIFQRKINKIERENFEKLLNQKGGSNESS